jgi:hypothetical protein
MDEMCVATTVVLSVGHVAPATANSRYEYIDVWGMWDHGPFP